MEPFDYLRAIRRNWRIVGAAVLIALLAAFFTRSIEPAGGAVRSYEATTVLYVSGDAVIRTPGDPNSPSTAAALTTSPPIAARVADVLGFEGDPQELAAQVTATVEQENGLINITATSRDPERTEELADTFAEQLLAELAELQDVERSADIDDLQAEVNSLERRLEDADPEGEEARNVQTELDQARSELTQLRTNTPDPPFTIFSPAVAKRVTSAGFSAPRSFSVRLIIAGVIGLLAGIIIAIVVGRLDTRIRTKRAAEDRFSAPVLAEVPVIRGRNRRGIVATTQPASRAAEEFRLLGAELSLSMAGSNGNGAPGHRSSAVLVTSAGPAEGKSTVVANLATTLSEMGKKVLVLSCDFHRPTVHSLFGIENERGLADALASTDGEPVLAGVVQETSGHVDVVTSGSQPESSGELLSSDRMRLALKEARGLADIVLLDTPPILVSSDATHLLPQVDAVLLVARAARTEADLAERASELLGRMGAPVRGVVLNRASETPRPRGARGYYNRGPGAAKETLADDLPDEMTTADVDDRSELDRA
ncbi:MAG: polysaccharide biosynthesis tyrosine autokinase [Actinomycetota bacterium]